MGIKPMTLMQFKVGAGMSMESMGDFAKISSSTGRGTVIIADDSEKPTGITGGGTLHPLATKLTRSKASIEANNEVRADLLKRLGKSFGVSESEMYNRDEDGKLVEGDFSSNYLKNLKFRLGDALKFKDFGIDVEKGGKVSSGKPLTERRITAINQQLSTYRGSSAMAAEATTTGIRDLDLSTFDDSHFIRNFFPDTPSDVFLHNIERSRYPTADIDVDYSIIMTQKPKLLSALVKLHVSAKKEFAKCQSRDEMIDFATSVIDKINAVFDDLKEGYADGSKVIGVNKEGLVNFQYDTEFNHNDENYDGE